MAVCHHVFYFVSFNFFSYILFFFIPLYQGSAITVVSALRQFCLTLFVGGLLHVQWRRVPSGVNSENTLILLMKITQVIHNTVCLVFQSTPRLAVAKFRPTLRWISNVDEEEWTQKYVYLTLGYQYQEAVSP